VKQRCALHRGVPLAPSAILNVPPQEQDRERALHPVHSRWPIKVWVDPKWRLFEAQQFRVNDELPVGLNHR